MKTLRSIGAASILIAAMCGFSPVCAGEKQAELDADGVYHVPAFVIPPSPFVSDEYKRVLMERGRKAAADRAAGRPPAKLDLSTTEAILKVRQSSDAARKKIAEDMQKIFPVTVTPEIIGGVQTDVVMPREGVSARNKNRILINLHGGGMMFGARYEGQVAAIPIASLGRIKVVTVDYRMAPEHRFPAASEDVAKVYRALLRQYRPHSVGIYGHSSGAFLTAQSVAWFQVHELPVPGAVSLDGGGAVGLEGDSTYLAGAFLFGIPSWPPDPTDTGNRLALYLEGADRRGALVAPGLHPDVLAKFPPTLVMNATRDPTLSGAVFTHSQLTRAGVEADLHIWEGVSHSFHYDASLPESRESYDVLIEFFDEHLGR